MDKKYAFYWLHNPVANAEAQITDFDIECLEEAELSGLIIIGETEDGTREVIHADQVAPPEVEGFTVVAPGYVNARMDAVVAVFDALDRERTAEEVTETGPAKARARAKLPTFEEALANLKTVLADEEANA